MAQRIWYTIAGFWLVSLLAVGSLARAQSFGFAPAREPFVLSGSDVGIRIDGMVGEKPVGTMVVRWKGQWVEVGDAPSVRRIQ